MRVLDEERPSCWLDRRTVNTTLLWIPTAFPVDVFASQEKRVERRYTVDNGSLNLQPSACKFNPGAPVVVRECDSHLVLFFEIYTRCSCVFFTDLGLLLTRLEPGSDPNQIS